MNKTIWLNLFALITIPAVVTITLYAVNLTLFSTTQYVKPADAFFLEGILFIILGVLFFLGSGGINRWSLQAAILGAAADGVYGRGKGGVGPAELFRRDSWKSRGFPRIGLLLLLTGFVMLVIYFVSLMLR
jgi:hypothetical protein